MAPAMPTPSTRCSADESSAAAAIVLTASALPGEAEPVGVEIITGLELRLVPSPAQGEGVLFERVAVDDHPAVANHLEDLCATPIIATGPLLSSSPRAAPGQPLCGCWQSLRLLGSARRHDHDHLTGTSSVAGCPACGRGLPGVPRG